jgi:hypothetical protein
MAASTLHVGFAAPNLDFTGKYLHKGQKGNSDIDPEVTLEVAQHDGAIEITKEELGSKTTNRFTLDYAESDCLARGDIQARCKAKLKGKSLILESVVLSEDRTTGNPVHLRTVEEWQLSGDSKTLTVKVSIDSPDRPAHTEDSQGQSYDLEKFTRQ